MRTLLALAAAAALAGCVNLAPTYERPSAPVPGRWNQATEAAPAPTDWQSFIADDRLRQVIASALDNNRDLRVATLNIERARAQYRIARASTFPTVDATAAASRQHSAAAGTTSTQYSVGLALNRYEFDFFGKVRNLGNTALESFFAVEENRRSAQLALVAEVATAWLTLSADTERLLLVQDTLANQEKAYDLVRRTRELGGTSGLALAQSRTTVESARVDVGTYTSRVAQDRNALDLLVGATVPAHLLPTTGTAAPASLLVGVPAGVPSEVLLRRPDVLAAEHQLKSANANVGAVRAALFPSIALTASAGTQSRSLSDLFGSGTGVWSLVPQIDIPLFDAGVRRSNVQVSETQLEIAVATYEGTVQSAFRDVADALADRATLADRLAAQDALVEASQQAYDLSNALFKNGASSYLDVLVTQRSLYAARQSAITLRLEEQANRVALYRVLGGAAATP
jgi:multidrug efflux system outer membrane protein